MNFPDKQKRKEFDTSRPAFQEVLGDTLQSKKRLCRSQTNKQTKQNQRDGEKVVSEGKLQPFLYFIRNFSANT